jgi:hypothetical protein
VGSDHRIALQTMTTTDTRNVQLTVDQVSLGVHPLGRPATLRVVAAVGGSFTGPAFVLPVNASRCL